MMNEILLNLYLFLFLFVTIVDGVLLSHFEKKHLNKYTLERKYRYVLIFIFILCAGLLLKFLPFIHRNYLEVVFSFLLIIHSGWMMVHKTNMHKILIVVLSVFLILVNFIISTTFFHNLLVIFSISWIGYFLKEYKILTFNRLVIISFIWVIYDIIFAFLTQTAIALNSSVEKIHFPLGMYSHFSLIGSADLLFCAIAISLLPTVRMKVGISIVFVMSNILLTYLITHFTSLTFFPMLVVWAPIGIVSLLISCKQSFSMKV